MKEHLKPKKDINYFNDLISVEFPNHKYLALLYGTINKEDYIITNFNREELVKLLETMLKQIKKDDVTVTSEYKG